ncbi:MAG: CotH kinase family protein [Crocinitomicaceae bacterium]
MSKIFFTLVLLSTVLMIGCSRKKNIIQEKPFWIKTIFCDFESIDSDVQKRYSFKTDSANCIVKVQGTLNTNDARSGSTSIQLDANSIESVLTLTDLRETQLIEISIWQKEGDSSAFILGKLLNDGGIDSEFKTNYKELGKSKKGWKQHFLSIPIVKGSNSVSIYLKAQDSIAIFDDLKVYIYPVMPTNNVEKDLSIWIPSKSKKKLTKYIEKSLGSAVISEKSKKYVSAYYLDNEDTTKIKIKIKGDWSDHIAPDKASYRFKLPSTASFEKMSSFSIQHPKARNFLSEWIMHIMADKVGILSTKYEFINVNFNGYNMGLYALEEHFDKHIVENRKRREGPILKLDESGTWRYREKIHNDSLKHPYPDFEASYINAFHEKRILRSEALSEQFNEGKKLLQLFRDGHLNISDIFDIDLLAKYYVLIEISGNYHALTWHNRRFYFNPITQKLEHIFFDAIPNQNLSKSIIRSIIENKNKEANLMMDNAIIMDKAFKEKYLFYLKQYTDKTYIDSIFEGRISDLDIFHEAILKESPNYEFSITNLYDRIKYLRTDLNSLSKYWDEEISDVSSIDHWAREFSFSSLKNLSVIKGVSVNAYIKRLSYDSCSITFENFHPNDVEILAARYQKNGEKIQLKTPQSLNGFKTEADSKTIHLNQIPQSLFFADKSVPLKMYKAVLIPWEKPRGKTTMMNLNEQFSEQSEYFSISNNILTFNKLCKINQLIYIPSKYKVNIEPGTVIVFENGGGLIVNNTFICKGEESSPIKFICNDNSSQGLTILKGKEVNIQNTSFEGLSNLNYKNWRLTGAITIYESTTTLKNVIISGNQSEDALNIVRSNFEIDHIEIANTYSDGFDADFSTGFIKNSVFKRTGNDCVDFSGSKVFIENISIVDSGDKGISGGEESNITINGADILGAKMGIASKDASIINGKNISVSNSEYHYTAFQKKSNYGPSQLILNKVKTAVSDKQILVEKGSSISINDQLFKGTKKIDTEALYSEFQKK